MRDCMGLIRHHKACYDLESCLSKGYVAHFPDVVLIHFEFTSLIHFCFCAQIRIHIPIHFQFTLCVAIIGLSQPILFQINL